MAFIKCSGGGKLKETKLWENPDTTKTFATQTITLNYGGVIHNAKDYDFLKLTYIRATGAAFQNESYEAYSSWNTIVNNYNPSLGNFDAAWAITSRSRTGSNSAKSFCTRNINSPTDLSGTQLSFTSSTSLYDIATQNTQVIPKALYGLK